MIANRKILQQLTNQALARADQKEEVKAYCQERFNSAFENWEEDAHDKAIQNVKDVISILPKENFLYLFIALLLSSSKDTVKSNRIVNQMLDKDLTDDELNIKQFVQSCNCFHDRHFEKAITYANKIIARNENAFYAYLPRAMAFAELDEHTKAISDYKTALKEGEQVKGIKAGLAFSYMKCKKNFKALWLHLSIIRHFKDNFRVNHNIGLNFFMLSLCSIALSYINKSIKLKPDFADAYRMRGLIFLAKGNSPKAIEEFERARAYGAKGIDKTMKRFNLKSE